MSCCESTVTRLAAKIFVFVISRYFREIFNFVFREIFLEFREILQTRSKNLAFIFEILQNMNDIFKDI